MDVIGFLRSSVKIIDKDCTIKALKDFFETYVVIDMKVVGTISSKEEALQIQTIAKLCIVAQRARYLGRMKKNENN